MVIDTSVLIAILANEPEAELFEAAIDADPIRLISAASVLESEIQIVAVAPTLAATRRDGFYRRVAAVHFAACGRPGRPGSR
jgi:uncharacterized protein with PIN domain